MCVRCLPLVLYNNEQCQVCTFIVSRSIGIRLFNNSRITIVDTTLMLRTRISLCKLDEIQKSKSFHVIFITCVLFYSREFLTRNRRLAWRIIRDNEVTEAKEYPYKCIEK